MKLHAPTYVSPNPQQGTFTDVYIEEVATQRLKNKHFYKVDFEMYYDKNGERIVIYRFNRAFQGMDGEAGNTNKTMIMKYPNPDYDPNYEYSEADTEEVINQKTTPEYIVPVRQYLSENAGQFPLGFEIIEWGYPNYEDLKDFFSGDDFGNEDIIITNPLAEKWFLNQVENGELIGNQFQFV